MRDTLVELSELQWLGVHRFDSLRLVAVAMARWFLRKCREAVTRRIDGLALPDLASYSLGLALFGLMILILHFQAGCRFLFFGKHRTGCSLGVSLVLRAPTGLNGGTIL